MKKYLLSIIFLASNLFASPNFEIIYQQEYKNLPFNIEIENSGIYSIASFDVNSDTVLFSSFNVPGIYKFHSDKFISRTNVSVSWQN